MKLRGTTQLDLVARDYFKNEIKSDGYICLYSDNINMIQSTVINLPNKFLITQVHNFGAINDLEIRINISYLACTNAQKCHPHTLLKIPHTTIPLDLYDSSDIMYLGRFFSDIFRIVDNNKIERNNIDDFDLILKLYA